jgi:hypothetical protein
VASLPLFGSSLRLTTLATLILSLSQTEVRKVVSLRYQMGLALGLGLGLDLGLGLGLGLDLGTYRPLVLPDAE